MFFIGVNSLIRVNVSIYIKCCKNSEEQTSITVSNIHNICYIYIYIDGKIDR